MCRLVVHDLVRISVRVRVRVRVRVGVRIRVTLVPVGSAPPALPRRAAG